MQRNRNDGDDDLEQTGPVSPAKARKEKLKLVVIQQYLRGANMEEVKTQVDEITGARVTSNFVNKTVNEAIERWKRSKTSLIENHKAIELEKINRLEQEYWAAWVRSRGGTASSSEKKVKGTGKKMAVAEVRNNKSETLGDAKFLQGVQWCIDKRCEILGIEVPQIQINNQVNNNSGTIDNSTTIVRRVVFKTRETTAAPQVIAGE